MVQKKEGIWSICNKLASMNAVMSMTPFQQMNLKWMMHLANGIDFRKVLSNVGSTDIYDGFKMGKCLRLLDLIE